MSIEPQNNPCICSEASQCLVDEIIDTVTEATETHVTCATCGGDMDVPIEQLRPTNRAQRRRLKRWTRTATQPRFF
jgi:hypothetical protein